MTMKNKEFNTAVLLSAVITVLAFVICLFINIFCAFVCLASGIVLTFVFWYFTHKRYKQLSELNTYLSSVCAGNYDLDINDNAEGELSILKNNLYKVIVLLRSSNEQLNRDKNYLSDSLADISHQLKTPLTSIVIMTELIKEEKDVEKRTEFVKVVQNQIDKMQWLILTLLKLSKLDAGTVEFNIKPLKASEIIESSIQPFLITADLKGIEIIKNANDFIFSGDENWTVEAVQNIVKNCIEHTGSGGRLEITADENLLYKRIVIRDTGCGIAEKDLPHIFERFYHCNDSDENSVGIGLALSKAVLLRERADVIVESQLGKGSTFEIRFYKTFV